MPDLEMGDYKKLRMWQEREDNYAIGYRLSAIGPAEMGYGVR